jgi:hypothetical protein
VYSYSSIQPEYKFTVFYLYDFTSLGNFSRIKAANFLIYINPFILLIPLDIKNFWSKIQLFISIYKFQMQLVEKFDKINEEKLIYSRKILKAGVYVFELSDGKTTFAFRKKNHRFLMVHL